MSVHSMLVTLQFEAVYFFSDQLYKRRKKGRIRSTSLNKILGYKHFVRSHLLPNYQIKMPCYHELTWNALQLCWVNKPVNNCIKKHHPKT